MRNKSAKYCCSSIITHFAVEIIARPTKTIAKNRTNFNALFPLSTAQKMLRPVHIMIVPNNIMFSVETNDPIFFSRMVNKIAQKPQIPIKGARPKGENTASSGEIRAKMPII